MTEVNFDNKGSKNPAQLLRMFVVFSVISLVFIVVITGYGILAISREANIEEAEHDAIGVSRAFLGKEGEFFLDKLARCAADPAFQEKKSDSVLQEKSVVDEPVADLQRYYTIQVGSFRKEAGALVTYEELLAKLPSEATVDLRVENIGDYYAVRLGKFDQRQPALGLLNTVTAVVGKPLLLKVRFLPERIVKQVDVKKEVVENMTALLDADVPMAERMDSRMMFDENDAEDLRYDQRIRKLLKSLNVVKIKMFSIHKIIVYSTDWSIIGKDNSANERLVDALAGNINSLLKKKDKMTDIVGEEIINLDVVETYLPVISLDGEIIGAFEIYMDISRYRVDTQHRVVKSVAMISLVLLFVFTVLALIMRRGTKTLSRVQDELFKLSSVDSLTGLLNRRFLFERMTEEYARIQFSNRKKQLVPSFGCIMIDIDFFKKFNDTYGHQVGDSVLKFVASCIESSLRQYDVAGRYGGEEFLVLLPNSSMIDAKRVAERIWSEIRSESYTEAGQTYNVTVSVGYSCATEEDENFEIAIGRADQALYQAKELGRDQVCTLD